MSQAIFKLGLVVGGLIIAAAITIYPWTYWDKLTGTISTVYGMSAMIWAPAALIIGIGAGVGFAVALWPRQRTHP